MPKATGVQFKPKDAAQARTISTAKEVLLCAGAFQSPQLLELSGIGSPALLQQYGIKVVLDNPNVGENLQDHCITGISFEVVDGLPTLDMNRDPAVIGAAIESYTKTRSGPLVSVMNSIATFPVMEFQSEKGRRDLADLLDTHLQHASASPVSSFSSASTASQHAALRTILENPTDGSILVVAGAVQFNFDKSAASEVLGIIDPNNYITLGPSLTNPFSRGSVHITSASVAESPAIDPNYLSHPLDLEILARHAQYLLTIASTEPLSSLLKPGGKRIPPNPDLSTIEAAKEHCRRNLISNWHPCGSCAMMPRDQRGVVDERLKVHGISGLRVVDASVFPMIPKGNIQSSVYAVAERAADLIKEDWGMGGKRLESGG